MEQGLCPHATSQRPESGSLELGHGVQPPGPQGEGEQGCLAEFRRNPMAFCSAVANRYGGIATIPLGKDNLYLVSEPELIHELLITNRNCYMKNVRYEQLQRVIGQGLLLTEGEIWKQQRMEAQPAFKPRAIAAQVEWMAPLISDFFAAWEGKEEVELDAELSRLGQLLSGRMVFGPGFIGQAGEFVQAIIDIKRNWPVPTEAAAQMSSADGQARQQSFEQAMQRLDNAVYRLIREEVEVDDGNGNRSMLRLFIQSATAAGAELDQKLLRNKLLTLFFAGYETSATGLCWLEYLLTEHPRVRERVQAEIDSLFSGRLPNAEDLASLSYTEQVIQESLRIYSPIHSLSRVAIEPNSIGGYPIAAGATIMVSLYATHRLEKYWPDPERFDPDRFAPEACKQRAHFAYIPFAAGHRNCIGASLAMVELKLMVAILAQRFVLELVPGQRIEPAVGTTMYPRYGMRMRLEARMK